MIDTVHFRIHGLTKHHLIVNKLETTDKTGSSLVEVDQSILEQYEGSKIKSIIYHDRGGVIPLVRRSNMYIPSSHYSLSYLINYQKDCIEFNVALPKYYYSTNVIQLINFFDQSSEMGYKLLKVFFHDFFKRNFISECDYADIEIYRIDLCFNQFFTTRQQALSYLDEQKKMLIKFARAERNKPRTYESSLMYVTKRYSFKIYHKGTEFKAHDRKELLRVINSGKPTPHDKHGIAYLEHHADRCLRYEMTYRGSGIDYVFKRDIFEANTINRYADVFKRMILIDNHRAAELLETFKSNTLKFKLQTLWDKSGLKLKEYLPVMGEATFCAELFVALHKRFVAKCMQYQLNIALSPYDIKAAIDKRNEVVKMKNKFRKTAESQKAGNYLLVASLLSQHMDLNELRKFMSNGSFYRMKSELKAAGINLFGATSDVKPPPFDYMEYKLYFGKYHNSYN